jgi:Do/DeqQ family serine protease
MRRLFSAFALIGAVTISAPSGFAAAPVLELGANGTPSLAPMLSAVTPGVVNIAVKGRVREQNPLLQDPFFRRFFNVPQGQQYQERETMAAGSGVIVDAHEGYVLTNAHVVENAISIEVTAKDNRRYPAKLIGRDADTDVAVLKIEPGHLTAVPLGDSDKLQVGDFVVAIGNPFKLGQTVTSGIVSALGRSGLGIEGYEDFIQTDASINPGNSGGALIDLHGQLIGINTAILAPGGASIGIGFAVPINMARRVMDQLTRYGEVKRGRIGVTIQDFTPDLAEAMKTSHAEGAVIARVESGSAADRAGLKSGDLVIAANGVSVHSGTQLRNAIGLTRIGDEVRLTVDRAGAERAVAVKVEPTPQAEATTTRKRLMER